MDIINDFEIDLYNNIWLFTSTGEIYVLNEFYELKKSFDYLDNKVYHINYIKNIYD